MADDQPNPPVFGPAMSPSIFAAKWLTKHRDLLDTRLVEPLRASPTAHPIWIFKLCYDAIEHLIHFYRQAHSHSLKSDDFPDVPARTKPISTNAHLYSPADLPSMQTNPFLGASMLTITVDGFVRRLRLVKGGETISGMKWEEFSVVARDKMQEVFDIVEQAERDGWWQVPEDHRRETDRQMREKERRDYGS